MLALSGGLPGAGVAAAELPAGWSLEAGYVGEGWQVGRGGLATGTRYLDNAYATFAAEDAFGRSGLRLFAHALYNNGEAASGDLVGDAQGISNIEAVRAARLFQAWAEIAPAAGHSLRFGLYDLNSEFDAGEAEGLFLNGSHGMGPDASQSGANGVSIFPVTGLALRYRVEAGGRYAQLAVLEGTPGDPDDRRSNAVRFDDGEGVLLAGEAGLSAGPLTKLAVGAWHYTADFEDLRRVDDAGVPLRHGGNQGAYLMLESGLGGDAAREDGRWRAFLRYGVAADDFNAFSRFLGAGLVRRGTWPRGEGQVGLAVARVRSGAPFRDAARAAGAPVARHETNLELTWRIPVSRRLTLQPDLQYVIHPGVDPVVRDALAVGLRFHLSWVAGGG